MWVHKVSCSWGRVVMFSVASLLMNCPMLAFRKGVKAFVLFFVGEGVRDREGCVH